MENENSFSPLEYALETFILVVLVFRWLIARPNIRTKTSGDQPSECKATILSTPLSDSPPQLS